MCLSQIPLQKIVGFVGEFANKFSTLVSKPYNRGVLETIQVQYAPVLRFCKH